MSKPTAEIETPWERTLKGAMVEAVNTAKNINPYYKDGNMDIIPVSLRLKGTDGSTIWISAYIKQGTDGEGNLTLQAQLVINKH